MGRCLYEELDSVLNELDERFLSGIISLPAYKGILEDFEREICSKLKVVNSLPDVK